MGESSLTLTAEELQAVIVRVRKLTHVTSNSEWGQREDRAMAIAALEKLEAMRDELQRERRA